MLAYLLGTAVALAAAWLARGSIIYQLEVLINTVSGARQRGADSAYRRGAFAPVDKEVLEGDLPVEGELPSALDGMYVRNGPSPHPGVPVTGDFHWFDGDGMVHAVRIRKGKASYANHWVQTSRLKQELRARRRLFTLLSDMRGQGGLALYLLALLKERLGVKASKEGFGPANTSLAFHNKQLLALVEVDQPYVVRVHGDAHVETLERLTFGGKMLGPWSAHPKKDPATGELLCTGWSFSKPHAHFFRLDKEGRLQVDVPIDLPEPVFMHDMAFTKDYAIILDLPLVCKPERMAQGRDAWQWEGSRAARIGLLPRGTEDGRDVRWFRLPPLWIWHTVNAWQEGGAVLLYACVYDSVDFNDAGRLKARVEEIRLDTDTGEASRRVIADIACEFPVVPAHLMGRKCRYAYIAEAVGVDRGHTGLVKVGLAAQTPAAAVVARLAHGPDWMGGEATFVPRSQDPGALKGEDDGYLVTFVTRENGDASELRVYDAASMAPKPVAAVRLPQRVPLGFHGTHVGEADFQSQFPFDIHFLPDL